MWVALVGPEIEENLSLRYIASSLAEAGFDSELIAFNGAANFGDALAAIVDAPTAPCMVGISLAFQWRAQDFLAFAMALRESGYRGHITLGGHFATFACRELVSDFPEVDSIVRQEAEHTIVAIARAIRNGSDLQSIAGLALRNADGTAQLTPSAPLPDIHALPWPDRRGAPARCFGHGIAPLVGSRGCYANCSFCCIAAWQEQALPGKRYRLRDVGVIADEMLAQQQTRDVDIFVFHDDNFFLPGHKRNLERLGALADAIEARGFRRFATVVKARPTDVDDEVFELLQSRLHCIRVYIGIETDADQGLQTLRRWSQSRLNHTSIEVVRRLGMYTCFNMLVFDPDTTIDSLETNIAFIRYAADYPSNFGRVELYAGTPLLARMLAEGRCRGDYMQHDYTLASPEVERIFALTMACFHERNFGASALNNRIMATRFDLEVCRHFHSDVFEARWLREGVELSTRLAMDSADALTAIVDRVKARTPVSGDAAFVTDLSRHLRAVEHDVGKAARRLAATLQRAVGQGEPLTDLGRDAATPLQRAVAEVLA